jgi:type IV pilus assembly protein PilM
VIVKKIQMDRMKEEDAREVIRWEAEQYVPFDMENVQLDFQILDPMDDGLQMNVLLVAAKRDLVDQKVGAAARRGARPRRDRRGRLRAAQRLRVQLPGRDEGVVALVNVGHEISTVNVLQDGVAGADARHPLRLAAAAREPAPHARPDRGGGRRRDPGPLAPAPPSSSAARGRARGARRRRRAGGGLPRLDGVAAAGPRLPLRRRRPHPRPGRRVAERLRARTEVANPLQRLRVRPGAASVSPWTRSRRC